MQIAKASRFVLLELDIDTHLFDRIVHLLCFLVWAAVRLRLRIGVAVGCFEESVLIEIVLVTMDWNTILLLIAVELVKFLDSQVAPDG